MLIARHIWLNRLAWSLQIALAGVFAFTAWRKFTAHPIPVETVEALEGIPPRARCSKVTQLAACAFACCTRNLTAWQGLPARHRNPASRNGVRVWVIPVPGHLREGHRCKSKLPA